MIEKKENNMIKHLNGYLKALNDICGGQNEFHSNAVLIYSDDDIVNELKLFSKPNIKNLKIIRKQEYSDSYLSGSIIKKMILSKPFYGLYPSLDTHTIPSKNLESYKDYCIEHIAEYINFAFMEEGFDISDIYSKDIGLYLVKRDKEYFITLSIIHQNIKILLFFYRKMFSKDEFYKLFDSLLT